jgi:hypothetical protein
LAVLYFLIEEKLEQLTVKQLAVKENGGMFVIEGWFRRKCWKLLPQG